MSAATPPSSPAGLRLAAEAAAATLRCPRGAPVAGTALGVVVVVVVVAGMVVGARLPREVVAGRGARPYLRVGDCGRRGRRTSRVLPFLHDPWDDGGAAGPVGRHKGTGAESGRRRRRWTHCRIEPVAGNSFERRANERVTDAGDGEVQGSDRNNPFHLKGTTSCSVDG